MSPGKQTRDLLQLARKDLRAAEVLGRDDSVDSETVGFHIQQAAEKTLKAWLLSIGAEYPRTHDLSSLLSELEDRNQPVDAYWDLVELNPFAVQFRYELLEEEYFDWEDTYQTALKLLQMVERPIAESTAEE